MARASSRRAKQAPGEQGKLQVIMASIEQAPGGHGANSRRAWSKLQEGSKLQESIEKNREE
jgi:hypothetical protein